VEKENDCYGVYQLVDEKGTVVYIGIGHILTSLKSHLPEGSNPLQGVVQYKVEYAGNEKQVKKKLNIIMKEREEKREKPPKYNLPNTRAVSGKVMKTIA